VLIGDAAHGFGPGAQGAALAMEDAALLVKMLSRLENDDDDDDDDNDDDTKTRQIASTTTLTAMFESFERKRRPRVESIGFAAEARNRERLAPSYWKSTLRGVVMKLMSWWYVNGWYHADYAYKIEDDL
jgi:2-polyprenyl-6-methoxyphenol hydroxylase-like FAD-dependent oxidoreductase